MLDKRTVCVVVVGFSVTRNYLATLCHLCNGPLPHGYQKVKSFLAEEQASKRTLHAGGSKYNMKALFPSRFSIAESPSDQGAKKCKCHTN